MSLFTRRPTKDSIVEQLVDMLERSPRLDEELIIASCAKLEKLLDPNVIDDSFRSQKIPEALRERAGTLLDKLRTYASEQSLATMPEERKSWPAIKWRLRPCHNCGSSIYLVVDRVRINEFSAGDFATPSPEMHMAFCRGCGRVELYARDLEKVRDYLTTPREVCATISTRSQGPYR